LHVVTPGEPTTGRQKVVPSVCVNKLSKKKVTYRFGYDNPNSTVVRIERGNDNRLIGASKGLPRDFAPGVTKKAFQVSSKNDGPITWVLDGLQATGTRDTPKCVKSGGDNDDDDDDDDDDDEDDD
jgi:hypothetical protein